MRDSKVYLGRTTEFKIYWDRDESSLLSAIFLLEFKSGQVSKVNLEGLCSMEPELIDYVPNIWFKEDGSEIPT